MTRRLSYSSDAQHSGLLTSLTLPGGLAVLDLFDPRHPVRVAVADDESSPLTKHLDASISSGRAELPDDWTRLAVVIGLDRWFELSPESIPHFSDSVLQADLALAYHDVGDTVTAAHYFAAAEPSLRPILDHLLTHGISEGPLFDEFARIYAAAPYGVTIDELRTLTTPRDSAAVPETIESAPLRPGRVLTRSGGEDKLPVTTDPRLIPARLLLLGTATARVVDDRIIVSVDLFPDVDADTPALSRLLVRALDGRTTLALSTLTVEDGTLTGSLSADLTDSGDPIDSGIVVDIFDSAAFGGPFIGEAAQHQARALATIREAYSWRRLAVTAEVLGRAVESATADAAATEAAARFATRDLPDRVNSPALGAPEGATRPSLAELVAEFPLQVDPQHM